MTFTVARSPVAAHTEGLALTVGDPSPAAQRCKMCCAHRRRSKTLISNALCGAGGNSPSPTPSPTPGATPVGTPAGAANNAFRPAISSGVSSPTPSVTAQVSRSPVTTLDHPHICSIPVPAPVLGSPADWQSSLSGSCKIFFRPSLA